MSIYGFAEKELVRLCRTNAGKKGETFSKNKDYKGAIKNAKEYLETTGMGFSELEREWEFLDNVRLIRNCLAHDAGEVGEGNENLKEAIDRTVGVSISNELQEIQLGKKLTKNLTDAVEKIIKKVYEHTY